MCCIRVSEKPVDVSEIEYSGVLAIGDQALDCYGEQCSNSSRK